MRQISRALDTIYLIGAYLAGLLLVTLAGLVVWIVVARNFGVFTGNANDIAGYIMGACSFFALAYTFRSHGHIRVSLIIGRLSGLARRFVETLCLVIVTGITGYLAYFMALMVYDTYDLGDLSEGAVAIPLWIPQTPLAAGASLFALAALHTLIESLVDYEGAQSRAASAGGLDEA